MDIGWEPHLGSQRDTSSRKAGSIGLCDEEAQVRGFYVIGDFVAQRREQLAKNVAAGQSFPVLRFEELFPDNAPGINEEIPGPRHTPELSSRLGVQDVIGLNGLGARIGKQRKRDLAPVREGLQYFRAVIAGGRDGEPLFFESCLRILQLDQLPLAVGSPVGGAKKKKNSALRSLQRGEGSLPAKLVAS